MHIHCESKKHGSLYFCVTPAILINYYTIQRECRMIKNVPVCFWLYGNCSISWTVFTIFVPVDTGMITPNGFMMSQLHQIAGHFTSQSYCLESVMLVLKIKFWSKICRNVEKVFCKKKNEIFPNKSWNYKTNIGPLSAQPWATASTECTLWYFGHSCLKLELKLCQSQFHDVQSAR